MIAGNSQSGPIVSPGASATDNPPAATTAMTAGHRGSPRPRPTPSRRLGSAIGVGGQYYTANLDAERHAQQSGPQQLFASGFRARMKALANLSSTSGVTRSTSTPAPVRNARASSTL